MRDKMIDIDMRVLVDIIFNFETLILINAYLIEEAN